MPDGSDSARPPTGWPRPGDEPRRAMVLGTYHMAGSGEDVVNVAGDDVLSADRQAELADLVAGLAEWSPDRVAVELPHAWQPAVEDVYAGYRAGERAFDRSAPFPEPFPDDFVRNEAVQVGFRLAAGLDHDPPLAIDHDHRVPAPTTAAAMEDAMRDFPAPEEAAYPIPDPVELQAAVDERLADATLRAYHRWLNADAQLRENHAMMFAGGLEHDDVEAAVGMLSAWYERNLRTVRTLWDGLDPGDERVLILYGSGHVRVLRHLLDETPMFRPVSPLPYL